MVDVIQRCPYQTNTGTGGRNQQTLKDNRVTYIVYFVQSFIVTKRLLQVDNENIIYGGFILRQIV